MGGEGGIEKGKGCWNREWRVGWGRRKGKYWVGVKERNANLEGEREWTQRG